MITYNKQYDYLDVNERIHFKSPIEVTDMCLGEHGGNTEAEHLINDECRLLTLKFLKDRYGNIKEVASKWKNEVQEDGEVIILTAPSEAEAGEHHFGDYVSLIFGKNGYSGEYFFMGAFSEDPEESTGTIFYNRRVATRVRLIGNPVKNIELVNEDRSKFTKRFAGPKNAALGRYGNWEVINDNLAACITQAIDYTKNGISISDNVSWFFEDNIDDIFSVEYEKVIGSATLVRDNITNKKSIRLNDDILNEIISIIETTETYPLLIFQRVNGGFRIEIREGTYKLIREEAIYATTLDEIFEHARNIDFQTLEKIAMKHSKENVTKKTTLTSVSIRDPYISEYTKERAKGRCELCGDIAPFADKKGKPYLECHHILWLQNGGTDSVDNTVALCPNCHRKMHIVDLQSDVDYLKNVRQHE